MGQQADMILTTGASVDFIFFCVNVSLGFFNYTLKYYDRFCVILINIWLVLKHLSVGCYRTHHASRL